MSKAKQYEVTRKVDGESFGEFCAESADDAINQCCEMCDLDVAAGIFDARLADCEVQP